MTLFHKQNTNMDEIQFMFATITFIDKEKVYI